MTTAKTATTQIKNHPAKQTFTFLAHLLIAFGTALLLALPWLIRVGLIFGVFTGLWLSWQTLDALYSGWTPDIPLLTLKGTVVLAAVAWIMITALSPGGNVWGGMMAAGLMLWGLAWGLPWLKSRVVLAVLPVLAWSMLMVYSSMIFRFKRERRGQEKTI